MNGTPIGIEALASAQSRVLAYALDSAIISVPLAVVVLTWTLDPLVVVLLSQSVYLLYFVAMWSPVGSGKTLGMRAVGIRIVSANGKGIGLGRAVVRYLGLLLGQSLLGLGVLWVLGDARRQGWHDKIAGTVVVREARAPDRTSA